MSDHRKTINKNTFYYLQENFSGKKKDFLLNTYASQEENYLRIKLPKAFLISNSFKKKTG